MRMLRFGGPGFASSDPGCTPMHHLASHAVVASHIEWGQRGMDVGPGPVLLSKKKKKRRVGRC